MKCRNEITIAADQVTVWRAFDNPANLRRWQPTLKAFEVKAGARGQPGQVAELTYEEKGRSVVMTETLTEKREPDFLAGTYDSAWSFATIVNHFERVSDDQTRWTIYSNHSFKGMMRFVGFLLRRPINARTDDWMQRFKLLVETEVAGKAR